MALPFAAETDYHKCLPVPDSFARGVLTMPIHVPPLTRRAFVGQALALTAGVAAFRPVFGAAAATDENFFALLSDTHIAADPKLVARDTNMTDNLRQAVAEIVALEKKPVAALINGDCAYNKGLPEDYKNLAGLVKPLAEAGLPLHLMMGNHDDRQPLYEALAVSQPERPPVESKHVAIVESKHANWFLLDSLTKTNVVTGELGEQQRRWLAKELDARRDKPAIVVAHHNPQFEPPMEGKVWGGLKDTAALLELLETRPHVKAFVFGHSHNWSLTRRNGLHLVNLPPVAYVFSPDKPNGWVAAHLKPDGMQLTLHAHDAKHPQNGEQTFLKWR
jgi:3',5'-cyclic AMP phosphodiesterase CpdA